MVPALVVVSEAAGPICLWTLCPYQSMVYHDRFTCQDLPLWMEK